MNSNPRRTASVVFLALLPLLVAPAAASAQSGPPVAAADGSGEAEHAGSGDGSGDELDWGSPDAEDGSGDEFDWDSLDAEDGSEDEFDWDSLDAEDGSEDEFDWDSPDSTDEPSSSDSDGYDWDSLDQEQDDTDWDSYWDELDSYEQEVEAIEIPTDLAEDASGIRGRVIDDQADEPFARADVSLSGTDFETATDADGQFFFDVAPGTYTLRVSHFELRAVSYSVLVEPGEVTDLGEIRMVPADNLATIVVEGRAVEESTAQQLHERQESATVQDAVSAEQISQAGDSSAGSAVRRVVGVTLLDDRFLVVRGLHGRYDMVTLNGAPVPLTDPDFPSAEVDMFPTEVLSSLTLAKNPTADAPSFTGGLMDVGTRAFPEEFELSLSLSTGGDTATTFGDFERDPLGSHDALGFDTGDREWPSLPAHDALDRRRTDDYEAIAHAMPNSWHADRVTARPDVSGELSIGDSVEIGTRTFGYLMLASYSNALQHREGTTASIFIDDDGAHVRERLDRETWQMETTWSALGNVSLELADGHALRLVSLWNHTGTESVGVASTGRSDEEEGPLERTEYRWVERNLVLNQLLGSHRRLLSVTSPWHETRIDWTASVGAASRDEPDTRFYKAVDQRWDVNPGSGEHFSSGLDQLDLYGDLTVELPYLDVFAADVGGSAHSVDRRFESRRLRYVTGDVDDAFFGLSPDEQFADANVTESGDPVSLREFPSAGDSYEIEQHTLASFATMEVSPVDWLRVTGGVRYQSTVQDVRDRPRDGEADPDDRVHRVDSDVLGSGSLIFEVRDGMFVRAVYGGSAAYPMMREIAPFLVQNYAERRTETGNPDLLRSYIHNADLRWEWFPSATEVVAASFFYKGIRHPIEVTRLNRQGDVMYLNADAATNLGAELEAQLDLGRIGPRATGLYVGANVAIVHSRVDLPCPDVDEDGECDTITTEVRPMQGQSPWQVNARFGWDPDEPGVSVGLVYTVLGRTLTEAGAIGLPDAYEEPLHQLGLTASYEFDEHWKLSLKLRNILLDDSRETAGGIATMTRVEPLDVSVGLRWAY